jgi:hypothetical protein
MRKLLFILFPLFSFGQTIINDGKPIECATRFTVSVAGNINGIKFYKGSDNSTYVVTLWDNTGKRINSNTITGSSGLVTVPIPSTPILPGITYAVSYYSPSGNYSGTPNYFPKTIGQITETGGYYGYAAGYPINTYKSTYYNVDPVFVVTRDTVIFHDTLYFAVHDTIFSTIHDTLINNFHDTIWSMEFDTSYNQIIDNLINNPLPFDIMEFTLPGGGIGRFHREVMWIRQKYVNGQWIKWE